MATSEGKRLCSNGRFPSHFFTVILLLLAAIFVAPTTSLAAAPTFGVQALNKDALPDGTYYVDINFLQALPPKSPSMADASLISHNAVLTVSGGSYFITFELGPISYLGYTNYLCDLEYYDVTNPSFSYNVYGAPDGPSLPTTVLTHWLKADGTPLVDDFNTAATPYPRRLRTPLLHKATDVDIPMSMRIPVMDTVGVGRQDVLLRPNWATLSTQPAPSSLTLSSTLSSPLLVGQQKQLVVTQHPLGSSSALTWSSSAPNVASVNAAGLVTAKAPGEAKITVRALVGDKPSASLTLQVESAPSALTSTLTTLYVKKGTTLTVPVMIYGSAPTPATLAWSSTKPGVATLETGRATGTHKATQSKVHKLRVFTKGTGTSTLTLTTLAGKKINLKVIVSAKAKALKKLKITSLPKKATLKVGATKKLGVKLTKGATLKGTSHTWKSSNSKVISVDAAGKIVARKAGKARVSVKIAGKTASVTLTAKK